MTKTDQLLLRLLLRSVYLKGYTDGNDKTTDLSWEDEIVKNIEGIFRMKPCIACGKKSSRLICDECVKKCYGEELKKND